MKKRTRKKGKKWILNLSISIKELLSTNTKNSLEVLFVENVLHTIKPIKISRTKLEEKYAHQVLAVTISNPGSAMCHA